MENIRKKMISRTFRLPEEIDKIFRKESEKQQRLPSEIIRQLIEKWIKKKF